MSIVRKKMNPGFIDSLVAGHEFLRPAEGTMTVCVLKMSCGAEVIGTSNVIEPLNFSAEMGEAVALENAKGKIWELEGYAIKRDLKYLVERAARAAHTMNQVYCQSIGDMSQPDWIDAPDWQKDSARVGVQAIMDNPEVTPAELHQSWLDQKLKDGWRYSKFKDPETKEHPCMVPYSELPEDQQRKDGLLRAIALSVIADVA